MFFFPSWWWKWWQEHHPKQPPPAPGPVPAPSPGKPPPFYRWFHRDSDMDGMSYAALVTAMRGTWMQLDEKTRTRQFRAFVLLSLRIAPLSPRPVRLGVLGAHMYSTQERNAAGSAIARTLVLLAPSGLHAVSDVYTEESKPARNKLESDTGELVTLIVVALATLCALAAVYLGAQATTKVNFDHEVTQRLLSSQAKAIEILSLHIERERVLGHELPFDDEERALLQRLEDDQRRLATLQGRPLPSPFEGATEFVQSTVASILPLALILLGAFVVMNKSERRS